jgi:4-hydroxybenzoate polyprenyltransferase
MLTEYKKRARIGMDWRIVVQLCSYVMAPFVPNVFAAVLVVLLGSGLFVWGCSCHAKGKGQHWAWGLLGFLSVFGLLVVLGLPDKHRDPTEASATTRLAFGLGGLALIVLAVYLATRVWSLFPEGDYMVPVIIIAVPTLPIAWVAYRLFQKAGWFRTKKDSI